jgi:hypothetical protein
VYREGSHVFRYVSEVGLADFKAAEASGLYKALTKEGLLVSHKLVEQAADFAIIKPELVPYISYPFEWSFGMRLWQFEQQQNLLEYPMGKIDGNALEQRTIPYYNDIANMVVQRHNALPKQPFVYRVGTFIPYFVPKNLEILAVADHQLDMFNCINQERNPELTLKRLIALGFNSVIFDTNTATIERESNGTLHKKVDAFVNFLNTPNLGTRVLVNDINAGIAFILLPPIQ